MTPARSVALAAIVLAGAAARSVALDRLPGINGDEAWYGVNVNELLAGRTPFLHTPSGNPVNPVHSLPLLLISLVASPSFAVLRAPEVCWGVLAIVLAYPLLARPLGSRAAALATLLLTVAPTALVYARFGWDPSGTPLVTLVALALALRDRPISAAAAGVLAFLVHPTNVFLGPMLLAAWAPHAIRRYRGAPEPLRRRLLVAGSLLAVIALPLGAALTVAVARMGRLPSLEMVTERVTSAEAWFRSGLSLVRLLSGVTATTYVAGPMPAPVPVMADIVTVVMLATAIIAALGSRASTPHARWLAIGLGVTVLMFHVVAGPVALEPGLERYAMALLVPMCLAAAAGLDAAMQRSEPRSAEMGQGRALFAVLTVAAFVAASSVVIGGGYFRPLIVFGGDAHPTFRTGHVEPKLAAYEFIRRDSAGEPVVSVFAEDWWIYWPTRYLALPDFGRVFVEIIGSTPPLYAAGARPPAPPAAARKVYAIVFADGAAHQSIGASGHVVFTASDPAGRPILHVLALPEGARPPGSPSPQ